MKQPARAYLFVPGNRPDRYHKALAAGADTVVIDLEDAVPPADKDAARETLARWLTPAHHVVVRINAADSAWFNQDLALLTHAGIAGVMLPKAESSGDIAALRRVCGNLPVLPLIETAAGFHGIGGIAASAGVQRLVFGSVDLQADLGMACEDEELLYFRSAIVLASRLAGLEAPVDGACTTIDDPGQLASEALRARRLGFGGKLCIHPRQVPVVMESFSPTESQIRWALRVIEADKRAAGAAVSVDGKMVDRPVVLKAMATLGEAGMDPAVDP